VALALRENRLVSFRALGPDAQPTGGPLVCAPVALPSGEVVGVLAVEEIPFLYLSTATERMVGMVGEWLGRALSRVRLLTALQARAIVDEDLLVFTEAYFRRLLEREFARAVRSGETFVVLRASLTGLEAASPGKRLLAWKAVSQIILQNLRATDQVCRHAREGCLWILGPLPGGGQELVLRRIHEALARYADEGADPAIRIGMDLLVGPGGFTGPDMMLQAFDALPPGSPA
jgi:GGDEF domain-containing protein